MLTVQTNLKTAPCTRAGASYGITSARTSTNARSLTFARQRAVSNTEALKDVVKVGGDREPAVMPGTPAKSPLPEEEMIRIAREFDPTTDGGKSLADDFEFVAPVIGPLGKEAYLNAIEMFSLPTAFPDLTYYKYSIFVDPFEPHRVWYMTRGAGKHEGLLVGPGGPVKATGKVWEAPPEMSSITINEEGKITSQTTGYVVDRRVGNTGGQGAVFGVLYAIGKPLPPFGSWRWKLLIGFGRIIMGLTGGGKKEMKQEQ